MGKLVEIKTKATEASVEEFINTIEDELKRKDSFTILEMMKQASNEDPKMWGSSMVGLDCIDIKVLLPEGKSIGLKLDSLHERLICLYTLSI